MCIITQYNNTSRAISLRGEFMNILEKCFDKNSNIVSRKIADEIILVPIKRNVGDLESVYTLNEVGEFIFDLIDGKKQVKELLEKLVDAYDVDYQEAEGDLLEFLLELEKIGGINVV